MKKKRQMQLPSFISICFMGGVLGAGLNSLFVWLMGYAGVNDFLGIQITPALTWNWLRPRLIWGGLWAMLFLPVIKRTEQNLIQWGLLLSLGPTLNQLFYVFPAIARKGVGGLELGLLTPALVLVANGVWGVVTAGWIAWAIES